MSCNYLTAPRVELKSSDTQSEISESGTATSGWTSSNWGSREELRDLVAKLGYDDVSELHQERFKVDRKKLEQMLSGDSDALIPADVFFAKIMEDTDTYITWPNKLKIGAKSKKDPHVRIAGRLDDVTAAKERIMTILNTRCSRVTMKMDVSYTDHSHIIGKAGNTIKRVMEETQCHVHFPDSNRTNAAEKSNQVSISGDIEGVENARSRVRELIPLIFGFELPIMSQNYDANHHYIIKIQEQYKVQVMFKTRPKLHATLVLVKGVEWEVEQAKQATLLLMDYMCEKLASQTPVQMFMEISPHHHTVVLGTKHSNLKAIMQYTGCKIIFPDAQDPNIPSLKKSNISISGNIHGVYQARQLLLGCLPILIIFDLPEDCPNLKIRADQISEIQTSCDLVINIRQKARQVTRACVIKGVEKYVVSIYKARNMILGIDEPPICADIPPTYHLPSTPQTQAPQAPSPIFPSSDLLPTPTPTNPSPVSPLLSPLLTPTWQFPTSTIPPHDPPFVGITQQPQFLFNMMQQSMGSSGYSSLALSTSSLSLEQSTRDNGNYSSISSNSSISTALPSPCKGITSPSSSRFNDSSDKIDTSSIFSEISTYSHDQKRHSFDRQSFDRQSLDRQSLDRQSLERQSQSLDRQNILERQAIAERLERQCLVDRSSLATPFDYDAMRLAGLRMMQTKPSPGQLRVPNNSWSGYGMSHTSPAGFFGGDRRSSIKDDDIWKSTPASDNVFSDVTPRPPPGLNNSNIVDNVRESLLHRISGKNWQDLASLLSSLGLDRYFTLLNNHEIDLSTFATLTDQDLQEIGINAFGARRKMLLAITELNKRSSSFSAAPGAERKSSTSSTSTLSHGSPRDNNNW